MTEPARPDEEVAAQLLGLLLEEEPEAPADLPANTIRTVKSLLTARELIDMTTFVFLLRFCVPFLDLVVAMIGVETQPDQGERR